jgi:hypothetical protein
MSKFCSPLLCHLVNMCWRVLVNLLLPLFGFQFSFNYILRCLIMFFNYHLKNYICITFKISLYNIFLEYLLQF